MSQTNFSRYKYMPDSMNEGEFLARFVVRQEIFEDIFSDIKNTNFSVPAQHQIIVGQRGQGKTTLLRRLEIAVRDDEKLSKFLLVVKFPEEQNNIRFLSRFWEEIAIDLEEYIGTVHLEMEKHVEDDDYDMESFSYLERALKAKDKKVLVLMDNIDVFLDTLKEKEQQRLREILLTSSTILIVGGSAQMVEQHYDYGKPFYQFFKITTLQGLNQEETIRLLRAIAREDEKAKIESIIQNTPERIEALRQLTDGIPRFAILLFDILIDDGDSAFGQMEKLLDEITPFYQDRLKQLPATLKDITHNIAMNWDGIETSEITKKTRLTSKEVSSQLQQLKKYHFVESVSIGKNNIYKIRERFFNIWYLMRYGRKKDIQRVEWLVKFLTTWYSKNELEEKSKKFISLLKTKSLHDSYVYHMSEALRYSGIDLANEHQLKDTVQNYLNDKKSNLVNDISPSCAEVLQQAIDLQSNGKLDDAIGLLEKSNKNLLEVIRVLGYFYYLQKSYNKAEQYYLKAIERGDTSVLCNIGNVYLEIMEYNKAEEYYLKAVECGDDGALHNLGILYFLQKEYDKAEEYYLKAIESGDNKALNNLGFLYKEQKEYDKAEKYYLKAIDRGDNKALNNLGSLYLEQKKYDKAEKYYLKAIANGNDNALFNLGSLYSEIKDYDKAEEYYLKAIEGGDNDALFNLGNLYVELKNYDKAEEYYLKAIEGGDNNALFNLGNLYSDIKDYDKAEEYYIKAIEYGDNNALFNLGNLYAEVKDYDKAEECYLNSIESGNKGAFNNLGALYKEQNNYDKAEEYYLKAIESGNTKALYNLGTLYKEQNNYNKAEEYYLKSIESGDTGTLNSLAWFYFEWAKSGQKALDYILQSCENEKNYYNTHTLATILLWNEEFTKSYEKFIEWLDFDDALENKADIAIYLNLLMAKGQYYKAKEFFEMEQYQLKDRLKPIWYALMTLMQNEFPNEIKKMGHELQESVNSVLEEIKRMETKYQI